MTTDPHDPTVPLPAQEPSPEPVAGAVPAETVHREPVRASVPATAVDRPRLEAGRYLAGAVAAVLVTALVAWVLHLVLTDVAGQSVLDPPDLLGVGDQRLAYAVDAAVVTAVAAVVLALLSLAPRPRLFFGWLMVLLAVLAVATPFGGGAATSEAVATAVLRLVVVLAAWSLLAGVAGRAVRPERLVPNVD